jgi:tetratricopeptide (TPR) repeat protein
MSPNDEKPRDAKASPENPPPDLPLDERTQRCLRLFLEDPAGLPAFKSLEELLSGAEAWDLLLEVYQRRADAIANRTERASLAVQRALILEARLARKDDAIAAYQRAIEEQPSHAAALLRLAALYKEGERWEDLARLLEAALPQAVAAPERFALHLQLAELNLDRFDRPEAAIAHYEEALAQDPSRTDVTEKIGIVLERLGNQAGLARHLEARAGQGEEGVAHLARAAALYAGPLAGEPGAAEGAIRCHERILQETGDPSRRRHSRDALIELARTEARWEKLAALLEVSWLEASDPEAALRELAEIAESRLEDASRAFRAWRLLLYRRPRDPEAIAACERLAWAVGEPEALEETLRARIAAGAFEGAEEEIRLHLLRARILEASGNREDDLAAALESVLALDPGHHEALERVCALCDRRDRPLDRARLLARLAEALPPDTSLAERGEAWLAAAQAFDALDDPEPAVRAYGKASESLPESSFPLQRLQVLHASLGNTAESYEAARAELSLRCGGAWERPGLDPDRERVLLEHAAVDATELGRGEEASDLWQALLARDPDHRRALDALAVIFEKEGDHEGLLTVLLKRCAGEESPQKRTDLLLRIADLYERELGEEAEAIPCLQEVLELNPEHLPAFESLISLCQRLERWQALIPLLERRAELAEESERAWLALERARICQTHLSDEENAIRCAEEALALDPRYVEAIRFLEDLRRTREQWSDLEALLEREAGLVVEESRRAAIALARAELWEGPLGDPARSADCWEEVLAISPDDDQARGRLVAHYESTDRWGDAVRLLEAELAGAPEPAREADLHRILAVAWETRLERPDKAVVHYRAAAASQPEDDQIRSGLHRNLARMEAWEELVALCHGEAERDRESRPHAWADALVEIARVHEEAQDDPGRAEALLTEVLDRVPEHPEAQQMLGRLLEARGDLASLSRLLDASLAVAEEPARRVAIAREALRVALGAEGTAQGDPARTMAACRRVVELGGGDDDVLRILCTRLEAADQWKDLLDTLTRRLSTAEAPETRRDVALRVAELWEDRFHRPDRALEAYRVAREADPTSLPALRAMVRLCRREERWEELLGVCEALTKEEQDPRRRAGILALIGEILHTRFGRDHDAMGNLGRCLEIDPAHEEARCLLETLCREHRRYRTLATLLQARLKAAVPEGGDEAAAVAPEAVSGLWEELGGILADHLDAPEDAAAALRRALCLASDGSRLRRIALRLESVYTRLGEPGFLFEIYPTLLVTPVAPGSVASRKEAAGLWARYGDLLNTKSASARRLEKAARAYARACALDPEGTLRFGARRDLLQRLEAHADLAQHLEARAWRAAPGGETAALWLEAGEAWERIHRPADAENDYRRAIEADPGAAAEAYSRLGALLERQGRREDLVTLCERQVGITERAEEELALRLRLGGLLRELPGQSARALSHYRRTLDLAPPSADTLRTIADLSLLVGDASGAADALERLLDLPPPREELAGTLASLARLWEDPLGRRGRATAYCRMWLEADPRSMEARDHLERLAEERGDWKGLAELIERRALERAPDASAQWRRLAILCGERLSDRQRAYEAWRRVLAAEPDALGALRAVAEWAPPLGRWREGATALNRLVTLTPEERARRPLRLRLARLLAPQAAAAPEAIEQIRALLDEGASGEEAREARDLLRNLLEREGRFEELAVLLSELLVQSEEDEKAPLHAALGEIYEHRLWRRGEAVGAYRRWLAHEPRNLTCLRSLQRLYDRMGCWSDRREMLQRELDCGVPDDRRLSVTLELADLWERRLQAPAEAAAEYEKALAIDGENRRALGKLARLYRELENPAALHRIVSRSLALDESPERAAALALELARLEAGPLARPTDAIGHFEEALAAADDPASVLEELAVLHRRMGNGEAHLETLSRLAEIAETDAARGAVFARMGRACWEAGDDGRARTCFERAAELVPDDQDSLRALRSLYEREGQWEGVAGAIERLVACTPSKPERAALATDLGELLEERLQDGSRAEGWYGQAISIDRGCRRAHARLGRRRFSVGDFFAAREHLSAALAVGEPVEARQENAILALELGISFQRLGEADDAIRVLREAVRVRPDLTDAWEELGRLYLAAGEWRSAAEALRVVAEAEALEEERRAEALFGLAVAERARGALGAGLEAAEGALALVPDRYAWRLLRAELLSQLDRPEDAAEAWRDVAEAAEDPAAAAEAFYRGGTILAALPGRQSESLAWFEKAQEVDPRHAPSLRRMADHAMAAGAWEEAKTSLERLCDLRESARDHEDLARVWWEGFGHDHRALEHLRNAIAMDGVRIEAVNLAVDICTEREFWQPLAELIEAYLGGRTLLAEHAGLLRRLAEVHAEKLYQPEKAAVALRALVDLLPEDLDARDSLAAVLSRSTDSYQEAVEVLRRTLEDAPLRASAWIGLAGVFWFQKQTDACGVAAEALRVIGSEAEEAWTAASRQAAPWRPDPERWRGAFTEGGAGLRVADGPTLLESLGRALDQAWLALAPTPPAAAVDAGAWLGPRRQALEEACVLWGLPPVAAIPLEEGSAPVQIFGGEERVIGFRGDWARETAEPVWRFLCHRAVAQIALGHGPAAALDPPSLRALLAALRRASGMPEEEPAEGFETFLDACEKAVGWRNRRRIRKALETIGNPSTEELEAHAAGLARSAERVALLACGDLAAAVAGVGALERGIPDIDPARDALKPLLEISPAARGLLSFAAGENYLSARAVVVAQRPAESDGPRPDEAFEEKRVVAMGDMPPPLP